MKIYVSLFLTVLLTLSSISDVGFAQDDLVCDLGTADDFVDRGIASYRAGNYNDAIADFTCALELTPMDGDTYNWRALAYWGLEDWDNALDDLDNAIEYDDDNLYVPYYNRGTIYWINKDYDKALADLDLALTYNPEHGKSYNNRGNIYYDRGQYELAKADYERAISLGGSEHEISYYNLGLVYAELGDYQQAVDAYTNAINARDTYAKAYLSRANNYVSMGQDEMAYSDYARWIELTETSTTNFDLTGGIESETLTMSEGQVFRYIFDGSAGEVLDIAARSVTGNVDPLLVLLDASGNPIAADDDSGVSSDAVIAKFALPYDGRFTLMVSHAGGGSSGNISLTISIDGSINQSFAIYELEVGETAVVFTTGGDKLNLREGPGLDFDIQAQMESGVEVVLLEGPRKNDGYVWWRIETQNGVEGWAVERVEEEQTLQLALQLGGKAVVNTANDTLNLRSGPGISFDVVVQLENGTDVTILEGPQVADDLVWWKLQTLDGQEGWAVERVGDIKTLVGKRFGD